jgi:hypothetical protein
MKGNKIIVFAFILMIIASSVYRVWDGRPWGFVPQMAIALFAGAIIKNKKWAIAMPLLSMFLSDVLYQVLYNSGLTEIKGFYGGQVTNYLLFGALTFIGFWMRNLNIGRMVAGTLAAPTVYFLASNFVVWAGGGGLQRPKTFDGLMMCYADGLPFYGGYVMGTAFFTVVLFGAYFLFRNSLETQKKLA